MTTETHQEYCDICESSTPHSTKFISILGQPSAVSVCDPCYQKACANLAKQKMAEFPKGATWQSE